MILAWLPGGRIRWYVPPALIRVQQRLTAAPRVTTTRLRVTAYTPTGSGSRTGITASGVVALPWHTAAGPAWMPFGTRIWIAPLHTWFTVQDRGGAIHGHRLDLCVPTTAQALRWGVKRLTVRVRWPRPKGDR